MTSNCSKLKSTHEFRSVIFPHKNVTQATTKDPQNASTTTIGSWQSQEPIKWSLHLPYKPLESALSRVRYRRIYVDEYVHQIIEWTEGKKNKSIHLYGLQIPLPPRKERRLPTQPPKITAAGYSCKWVSHHWKAKECSSPLLVWPFLDWILIPCLILADYRNLVALIALMRYEEWLCILYVHFGTKRFFLWSLILLIWSKYKW